MLYVVTATHNGLAHTQRLLPALLRLALPLRLVVVDNASTDDTVEWLMQLTATKPDGSTAQLVPRYVELIVNRQNLGAAGAWNQGIHFALQNNADAVLVCGNDTVPMPGTVERLWQLVQDGAQFVTGTPVAYDAPDAPVTLRGEGPMLAAPDFSFFMLTRQCIDTVGKWDATIEINRQIQFAKDNNGAGILPVMTPWNWGLFDDGFVNSYFEDNDYHFRAANAGVLCARDPDALFRHDTSATVRREPALNATFAQNAERFRAKWGGLPHEVQPSIQSCRPLNVTDKQWAAMSGGRAVVEIPREQVVQQAQAVYAPQGVA